MSAREWCLWGLANFAGDLVHRRPIQELATMTSQSWFLYLRTARYYGRTSISPPPSARSNLASPRPAPTSLARRWQFRRVIGYNGSRASNLRLPPAECLKCWSIRLTQGRCKVSFIWDFSGELVILHVAAQSWEPLIDAFQSDPISLQWIGCPVKAVIEYQKAISSRSCVHGLHAISPLLRKHPLAP